ncbi:hypothetical protein SAMN06265375_101852 [Muriicola jejuensis]|nr:hypothetical protein SAMN06265375_101852 [Muriicola jejuensis]
MLKEKGRTPGVYGLYEYWDRLAHPALERLKSLNDQEHHKRDEQASHQDEQVDQVKLFPHGAGNSDSVFSRRETR